jgi:hypothetical protein
MFSSRFGKSVGLLAACFFFAAATTAQSPDTANARPSASQERPKAQSLNASASESKVSPPAGETNTSSGSPARE